MLYSRILTVISVLLAISACDVINEKIEVADDAANRVVGKFDNSSINQTINNSLDSVGEKAVGIMPEAIRPPTERLGTDETPVLGAVPDPESASAIHMPPVNTGAANTLPAETGSQAATAFAPAPIVLAPGRDPAPDVAAMSADQAPAPEATQQVLASSGKIIELSAAGVTLKRVNIRLGPGTGHEILDTIEAGTPLRVAGKTSDGWLLIERGGQPFGFILGSLVRTDE